jgi:glutathione synthase/RimK-type ligase-like ATP-grasp enzyme
MYLKIRSRNYSANQLRKQIKVDKPSVFRLGSFTPNEEIFTKKQLEEGDIVEINTVDSCIISNHKGYMKTQFAIDNIKTANWTCLSYLMENAAKIKFPVIVKHVHSSKGKGIYYYENFEQLHNDCENGKFKCFEDYIVEQYHNYSREYRLHVDKFGCFLTHRKMLKNDAVDRWHRHHINTVWIVEDNPLFDKPTNWNEIVEECQKAIKAVGLDIGCVDVKVQNSKHKNPKFIILETNSAPALGEETAKLYIEELKKLLCI